MATSSITANFVMSDPKVSRAFVRALLARRPRGNVPRIRNDWEVLSDPDDIRGFFRTENGEGQEGTDMKLLHHSHSTNGVRPPALHKRFSPYPIEISCSEIICSETISISAKWNWCGEKEKVIIKTNLPKGPQRYGRSSKER